MKKCRSWRRRWKKERRRGTGRSESGRVTGIEGMTVLDGSVAMTAEGIHPHRDTERMKKDRTLGAHQGTIETTGTMTTTGRIEMGTEIETAMVTVTVNVIAIVHCPLLHAHRHHRPRLLVAPVNHHHRLPLLLVLLRL